MNPGLAARLLVEGVTTHATPRRARGPTIERRHSGAGLLARLPLPARRLHRAHGGSREPWLRGVQHHPSVGDRGDDDRRGPGGDSPSAREGPNELTRACSPSGATRIRSRRRSRARRIAAAAERAMRDYLGTDSEEHRGAGAVGGGHPRRGGSDHGTGAGRKRRPIRREARPEAARGVRPFDGRDHQRGVLRARFALPGSRSTSTARRSTAT